MKFDSIVIGGGPAGLACAIRLSRMGMKVLLAERRHLPQEKCCGEFLHPTAVRELEALLGKTPAGQPIDRVRISALDISREFDLSTPAMAVERRALSKALIEAATRTGVQISENMEADILRADPNRFEIRIGTNSAHSERLILAEGASAAMTNKIRVAKPVSRVVYGFSARMEAVFDRKVALAAVSGGYAGLCDLGGNCVNIAGLLLPAAYRRLAPNQPGFGARLLAEIPVWAKIVQPDLIATKFQAPVCADEIRGDALPNGAFVVGDCGGMSETAFGDGIARAFVHARILDEVLHLHSGNSKNVAREYVRRIKNSLHRPNRFLLRLAGELLRSPILARTSLRVAGSWIHSMVRRATEPAGVPS